MRSLLLLIMLLLSGHAIADQLHLVNGDRITGELVQMIDGKAVFKSPIAGELTLDWEQVAYLVSEKGINVSLEGGNEIIGSTLTNVEGGVVVAVDNTDSEFGWDEIRGFNVPDPVAPPTIWEGALSSSLGLTQSNRDAQNFNLDFDIARARATDRLTAKAAYAFANQSLSGGGSETTVDSWYARSQYDVVVSDKFFWYGSLRFDRDRVSDLDLRSVIGAGGGLTLWNNKTSAFRTTFGLSFLQESFTVGQQNNTVVLQVGTGLKHEFNSWLTVLHDTSYYPNPDDFGDFFLSSELVLRSALASNMFAEFKFVFDYDATPAPGAQQDNYRYTMGVGMRF